MAQHTNRTGAAILDPCTFEKMYRQKRMFNKSVSMAMRFGFGKCDAEDIAGEARCKITAGVLDGRFHIYEGDEVSYVLRAVFRRILDWKKRQHRRVQEISYSHPLHTQNAGEDSSCFAIDLFSANVDAFDELEFELVISNCLKLLPRPEAEAIRLIDIQGMSYRDFSAYWGDCEGTVKSRLHRARKMLRPLLLRAGIVSGLS